MIYLLKCKHFFLFIGVWICKKWGLLKLNESDLAGLIGSCFWLKDLRLIFTPKNP